MTQCVSPACICLYLYLGQYLLYFTQIKTFHRSNFTFSTVGLHWACKLLCVLVASTNIRYSKHYFLEELDPLIIGNLLVMIFALSTWKYVEKPFRKQNASGEKYPWKTLAVAGCSLAIVGTVGMYGHQRGFPNRNENMLRLAQNRGLSWECSGATTYNTACLQSAPEIAVWGDSNAMHFTSALAISFQDIGVQCLPYLPALPCKIILMNSQIINFMRGL